MPRGVIRHHLAEYLRARYPGWDEERVRGEVVYAMGSEGMVAFMEHLEEIDNEMLRRNPEWDWYLRWYELARADRGEGD